MELEIGRVIEACNARVLVEPVSRDVAALGLTWDSREVKPGFVYAAIVGERVDGHAFAASAIEAGAVAVLCTREFVHEPFCVINADDYYGVDAYRTMYQALQTLPRRGSAVMVGYLLKNTVSKYGTVTRGVCRTADDKLTAIHETMKIQQFPDGSIADMADGVRHELDGDSVVSMNFWGFSPTIYEDMERYFHDFLRHVGDDVKAECLLPAMVGDLMDKGELTVSVLHSADQWFGMTYHEDRPRVAAALQKLHDAGVYPDKLA